MKIIDVEQHTHEWLMARLGKPTASHAAEILTPTTLQLSKQAQGYRLRLLGEIFSGEPSSGPSTGFMERGTELEPESVAWYEMETDSDVQLVGFILTDDKRCGCSPDGLVGEDGGVEFKNLEIRHHLQELLYPKPIDNAHKAQIQWTLWITGRKWMDRVYYHPTFQKKVVRFERDEKYIEALIVALYGEYRPDRMDRPGGFLGDLIHDIGRMVAMGHVIPEPKVRVDIGDGSHTPDGGPSFDEARAAHKSAHLETKLYPVTDLKMFDATGKRRERSARTTDRAAATRWLNGSEL